jgi:hypothetical protein
MRIGKFIYLFIYFFRFCLDGARVRTDGVLPCVDVVKTRPRINSRPGGKNERMRSSGQ